MGGYLGHQVLHQGQLGIDEGGLKLSFYQGLGVLLALAGQQGPEALGYNSGPDNYHLALTNATALGANVSLYQSNTVILSNGANVGIGTPTPSQALEVVGTTQTTNAIITTALTGSGTSIGSVVGVGIRADGVLNLGQNATGNSLYLGY